MGEFLKELDLTEGRATGIPTIQDELKSNGSPQATIETDDARTYFLIDIPCHRDFAEETLSMEQIGVKDGVKDGVKELSDIQKIILFEIQSDPTITTSELPRKQTFESRVLSTEPKFVQKRRQNANKQGDESFVSTFGKENTTKNEIMSTFVNRFGPKTTPVSTLENINQ